MTFLILGSRSVSQVASRIQKYFLKLYKAGLPIPGRIPKSFERNKVSLLLTMFGVIKTFVLFCISEIFHAQTPTPQSLLVETDDFFSRIQYACYYERFSREFPGSEC